MAKGKRMKYNALTLPWAVQQKKTFIFTFSLRQVFLSPSFLIVNFLIFPFKLTFSGQVVIDCWKFQPGKVREIFYSIH